MKRYRLLIVDNEPAALDVMRRFAECARYEVVGTARNGQDAVDLNLSLCPDAVLLDLKIPKMNGLQALERMMATRPVPVIVCTAYHDDAIVRLAARAGVHGYLVKPFRLADVTPAIIVAISRFNDICALESRVKSLRRSVAARKWVEQAKLVLMDKEGMPEGEAHRYLQQESQRRRLPLANLARTIALSHRKSAHVVNDGSRLAA